LSNMRLRWEYPPGFKFLTSSSALNNFDNTWLVPEILPGEVKELHLEGEIKGLAGETKMFRVFVENQEGASWKVYKEAMASINLIAAPLVLTLNTVPADQKSVRAGDLLTYKLTWKNNFNAPLENLVLKVKLIGEMFDWNTLISAGNFNIDNQTITWSKLSQPFMASAQPLEQQEISFQIKLKNVFSAGINPNITTAANIYSSTQPEGLDIDQITSETGLILNVEP
jgi:hypothetical protein